MRLFLRVPPGRDLMRDRVRTRSHRNAHYRFLGATNTDINQPQTRIARAMSTFVPRQALPRTAALYKELTGDVTSVVATALLKLLPPITESSIIHDNGCGTGVVTTAVMTASHNPKLIYATDQDARMVSAVEATAAERGWPVEAEVMSSEALSFPDDMFTHSITNFVIHVSPNDAQIASHIFRTLRPGGTAVLTIWKDPVLVTAVQAALDIVRPGMPYPQSIERAWFNASHLQELLQDAGFIAANVRFESTEAVLNIGDVKHWAEIAWSYLGPPAGGWTIQDEEQWDRIIQSFKQVLEDRGRLEHRNGKAAVRMPADIVIVVK